MDGHVLMFRRIPILLAGSALLAASIAMASGCGSTTCSFTATCPGDNVEDAAPVIPADCDLTKSPKDSPTCIDNGVGVFVDKNGKPDAAGTKGDPLSSVAAAISKAVTTQHKRVYICDGTYDEAIKLSAAVSVFGGFDCMWNVTGVRPKLTPATGPAIEVKSVNDAVVIQDLDATGASDPSVTGSSAIGALVVRSKVTMRAMTLAAGAGQDGAKGTSRSNYGAGASLGADATAGGGPEKTCACVDGTSSTGGHGASAAGSGLTDGRSDPPVGTANAGSSSTSMCGPGKPGAAGLAEPPADSVAAPGTLTENGWDATKLAAVGKSGHPGQGGGGGGANTALGGVAGSGGGCGGCGGAAGAPGTNGGASIGLISFESTVVTEGSTITAGAGGKGGGGGDGQPGQGGADGGMSNACRGGTGGAGAGGSGGAGGAGGDSIGVAWVGNPRPVLSTAPVVGVPGMPGAGGAFGKGSGNPGVPGKAGNPGRAIVSFPQ